MLNVRFRKRFQRSITRVAPIPTTIAPGMSVASMLMHTLNTDVAASNRVFDCNHRSLNRTVERELGWSLRFQRPRVFAGAINPLAKLSRGGEPGRIHQDPA